MSFQNSNLSYLPENWAQVYPIYSFQIVDQFQQLPLSHTSVFTIHNNLTAQFPNFYPIPLNQFIVSSKQDQIEPQEDKRSLNQKIQEKQIKCEDFKKQKHEKLSKIAKQNQKVQNLSCQCKKSNCLKQYCFCFKNGKGCGEKCVCLSCRNMEDGPKQKKIIKKSKQVTCNCKRTQCSKKYCECFAAGKGCGDSCKCIQCKN